MNTMAMKLQVGIAGCAVAAAASLTPVVAQAAPVPAPAAPAIFNGIFSPLDLLGGRAPTDLLQNTVGGTPFVMVNQVLDNESAIVENLTGGTPFSFLTQIINIKINIIRGIIQFLGYGCGCGSRAD